MAGPIEGPSASRPEPRRGSRLISIIPQDENLHLFQILGNGLSGDYANPLNAVAMSLSLVQMSLDDENKPDPFAVRTLKTCVKKMPTYTDFVVDTLLPRTQRSRSPAVQNLTRTDFVDANPDAVRRLDELAGLMRYGVRQIGDRLFVFPSTIAALGEEMAAILLEKRPSSFAKIDLLGLTKALLMAGGVRIGLDPGKEAAGSEGPALE